MINARQARNKTLYNMNKDIHQQIEKRVDVGAFYTCWHDYIPEDVLNILRDEGYDIEHTSEDVVNDGLVYTIHKYIISWEEEQLNGRQ